MCDCQSLATDAFHVHAKEARDEWKWKENDGDEREDHQSFVVVVLVALNKLNVLNSKPIGSSQEIITVVDPIRGSSDVAINGSFFVWVPRFSLGCRIFESGWIQKLTIELKKPLLLIEYVQNDLYLFRYSVQLQQ